MPRGSDGNGRHVVLRAHGRCGVFYWIINNNIKYKTTRRRERESKYRRVSHYNLTGRSRARARVLWCDTSARAARVNRRLASPVKLYEVSLCVRRRRSHDVFTNAVIDCKRVEKKKKVDTEKILTPLRQYAPSAIRIACKWTRGKRVHRTAND